MSNFSLVIFTDDILHICKSSLIKEKKEKILAPYGPRNYECVILSTGTIEELEKKKSAFTNRVFWNNCTQFIEKSNKCRRVLTFDDQLQNYNKNPQDASCSYQGQGKNDDYKNSSDWSPHIDEIEKSSISEDESEIESLNKYQTTKVTEKSLSFHSQRCGRRNISKVIQHSKLSESNADILNNCYLEATSGSQPKCTSLDVPQKSIVVKGHIFIQNTDVTFTIISTLHKGFYKCCLQLFDTHSVGVLTTYKTNCSEEICEFDSGCPCIIIKEKDQLKLSVPCCIGEGILKGVMVHTPDEDLSTIILKKSTDVSVSEDSPNSIKPNKKTKNKKHFCLFCNKKITCFSHHIQAVHSKEPEIIEILKMKANSKERNEAIKLLRLAGDKKFNLSCKPEDRILIRNSKNLSNSVMCTTCGGMYGVKNFSRHDRMCKKRDGSGLKALKQAKLIFKVELGKKTQENQLDENVNRQLTRRLLEFMREDHIMNTVKEDPVLYDYASQLAQKYRHDLPEAKNARQNLRQSARLLETLRSLDANICSMYDVFVVSRYGMLISAVSKVCHLDQLPKCKKPAVAVIYNMLLKKLAHVLLNQYLRKGRQNYHSQIQDIQDFLSYHKHNYNSLISKSAYRLLVERRIYDKKNELPSCEDTAIYGNYIKIKAAEAYKDLQENGFNYLQWKILGECIMLQLMFFNRRRVGEISKILLAAYENRSTLSDDNRQYLDAAQTILAENLQIIHIIGKRSRVLPVLLTLTNIKHLDMFVNMRKDAGVLEDNKYLFSLPKGNAHFEASSVIREMSKKCGAKKPDTLRGTLLRKQVATLTQLISMDENDIQQIADFMGHDVAVHKAVYRTPSDLLQITKLSKVFMAMSTGDLLKFKGKCISDIQVELSDKISEMERLDNNITTVDVCDWEQEINLDKDEQNVALSPVRQTPRKKNGETIKELLEKTKYPKLPKIRRLQKNAWTGNQINQISPTKTITSPDVRTPPSAKSTPQKTIHDLLQETKYPKRRIKLMWTNKEKSLIKKLFADCFRNKDVFPSKVQCNEVAKKYKEELRNRNGQSINVWIREEKKRLFKHEVNNFF